MEVKEDLELLGALFEEGCVCVICSDEETSLPSELLQGRVVRGMYKTKNQMRGLVLGL